MQITCDVFSFSLFHTIDEQEINEPVKLLACECIL